MSLTLNRDPDAALERRIRAALDAFHKARAWSDMQAAADRWEEFTELMEMRSL